MRRINRLGAGSLLGLLVAAGVYSARSEGTPETRPASPQDGAPATASAARRGASVKTATTLASALRRDDRATAPAAASPSPGQEALLTELRRSAGGEVLASVAPETDTLRFLKAPAGRVLHADRSGAPAAERARAFLAHYGELVGLSAAERSALRGGGDAEGSWLEVARVEHDALGETHVRFKQTYRGLPVFGAELVVHLNEEGVTGTSGTLVPGVSLATAPELGREQALERARAALAAEARGAELSVRRVELSVFRTGLLEGTSGHNTLAYAAELEGGEVHEQVWVDAFGGEVLQRIPLRHGHLNRIVYSPQYDPANPDLFVQRREGGAPSLLPQVNSLYDFAGQTYNLFASGFGRDSYNGTGATMRSVYLVNEVCPNAYWDGRSTNYCPGFDLDDVVAHEWGHAYTEYTHGLVYAYQSGALNESYSDIYGEAVDLLNNADGIGGANNAQPYPGGQRWLVGEDLGQVVHELLLRDMWDPERLSYPSKVSSANYHCASSDGGGVHTNSGVPNHAFAMLVDGKSFNGQTVRAIGLTKALAIYWRAASVYQTPISNFVAHADALEASCQDLTGQPLAALSLTSATSTPSPEVISADDCAQVTKAIAAVELRTPPTQCDFKPLLDPNTPAQCSGAVTVFSEDWERGLNGWALASSGVNMEWPGYTWKVSGSLPDGRAGSAALAPNHKDGTCAPGGDYSGTYSLTSPRLTVPTGGTSLQVRFNHFVETEAEYDGGNVRISVNGGAFTVVPQSAFLFNAPNAQLADPAPLGNNTNPKAAQWAWTGANTGEATGSWGTTLIALSSLVKPGDTFQLQFDFGIDGCNGVTGWFVDEVRVYDCSGQVTVAPTARFGAGSSLVQAQQAVTFDGSASSDNDAAGSGASIVNYTWSFGDGVTETTTSPSIQHTYAQAGTYVVTLKVTDNEGEVGTSTQEFQVQPAPARKPDLQVRSLTTQSIQNGARILVTLANTGDAAVPASRTQVKVDETVLGELDAPSIPAGGTAQVSLDWDARGWRGAHVLGATADSAAQVDEHEEGNNTSTRTVQVQGNKVK